MFQTLRNAFRVPELRKKLFYTFLMVIVFRLGSAITVPFLDASAIQEWMTSASSSGNFLEYMNILSGGALSKATLFALSVTPYINASIIVQLLSYAIPALEDLSKEGQEGRKKLNKITQYFALGLSIFMGFAYYLTIKNSTTALKYTSGFEGWFAAFVIIGCFVAGSSLVIWIGNRITEKGIGQGVSILLFAGIAARIPTDLGVLWELATTDPNPYVFVGIAVLIAFVALIAFVVLMDATERRIPISYAKRVVGRKQYGGQNTFLPIKMLCTGVMPIIFAMSFMSLPSTISMFKAPVDAITEDTTGLERFYYHFIQFFKYTSLSYAIIYFLLIVAFNFFYASMTFNPVEMANNLRTSNGAIPGIRPGKPTQDFIQRVLNTICLVGALVLGFIAIVPIIIAKIDGNLQSLSMGGTTMLIMVSVAIETTRAMESHMMMRHHRGFLK